MLYQLSYEAFHIGSWSICWLLSARERNEVKSAYTGNDSYFKLRFHKRKAGGTRSSILLSGGGGDVLMWDVKYTVSGSRSGLIS